MDAELYGLDLTYLTRIFPHLRLRSNLALNPDVGTTALNRNAFFFDYAIIHGRRFHSSQRSKQQVNNSVIQVLVSERGDTWTGEPVDIIHVDQSPLFQFTLGRFKWLRPLNLDLSGTLWASL
jgi:hypothetical protein